MKRVDTSGWPCTIARSAHLLGDHWNLLIIRQACLGTRRFDDFQAALGTGRNILTIRLKTLVDEGLLRRVDHDMQAVVVCGECWQPLDVHDVLAAPGPGHPG